LQQLPSVVFFFATNPAALKAKLIDLKNHAKHEAKHYYMGSKLLLADVRTSRQIFFRTLTGSSLTRRERKQVSE